MNCIIVDDDEISRLLIKHCVEQTDFLTLVQMCENAIEAANILRSQDMDLIFLDVEMPEMSGMEFIKTAKLSPQVILITSHDEYALEAFEYNVTDYLLKPINYARFLKAVSKAKEIYDSSNKIMAGNKDIGHIFIKVNSRLVKINVEDILWIESLADYVVINTKDTKFTVLFTMKGLVSKLPSNDFIRVHRSFIARIDKISMIEENELIIGKKYIPIGKSYKDDLMKKLNLI